MCLFRSLHPDAHMRPLCVVEADYALQDSPAFIAGGNSHLVQPLCFQYSVGALRDGVFKRISALCHADAYTMDLQLSHIGVAAVLASSVGVMYQTFSRIFIYRRQGHFQGLQRVDGLQCWTYGPANYLVRVGVGNQRQVAYTLVCLHIRYVGHPYLVRAHRNDIRDEVRILPVVVVGVRRAIVPAATQMYHKAVLAQYLDERIPARHTFVLLEQLLHYQIQLGASQTGIVLAVRLGLLNDERLNRIFGKVIVIPLVVRLPAVTKQSAEGAQRCFLARLA